MASVQKTIMDAAKTAVIAALTGRGYISDNVRLRRKPSVEKMAVGKKAVLSQVPERYTSDESTNETDDVGYGVLITLSEEGVANPEYTTDFDELITDRETVRHYFHNRRDRVAATLPAGYFILGTKIEPGPMLLAEHHAANVDSTALVLRVIVREPHG